MSLSKNRRRYCGHDVVLTGRKEPIRDGESADAERVREAWIFFFIAMGIGVSTLPSAR